MEFTNQQIPLCPKFRLISNQCRVGVLKKNLSNWTHHRLKYGVVWKITTHEISAPIESMDSKIWIFHQNMQILRKYFLNFFISNLTHLNILVHKVELQDYSGDCKSDFTKYLIIYSVFLRGILVQKCKSCYYQIIQLFMRPSVFIEYCQCSVVYSSYGQACLFRRVKERKPISACTSLTYQDYKCRLTHSAKLTPSV